MLLIEAGETIFFQAFFFPAEMSFGVIEEGGEYTRHGVGIGRFVNAVTQNIDQPGQFLVVFVKLADTDA